MDMQQIARAKDYVDALAKGINPVTGQAAPESDTINHVKIARCLFFVSEVLGKVLSGDTAIPRKSKLLEPDVEKIDKSRIMIMPRPVTVSKLTAQINDAVPQNMKKIKTTSVTNWLVSIGALEIVTILDKKHKYPTPDGNVCGITQEKHIGPHGAYTLVLYNENAQRFIVENLPAILQYEKQQKALRKEEEK